jgi:hypothetical protein
MVMVEALGLDQLMKGDSYEGQNDFAADLRYLLDCFVCSNKHCDIRSD